jgi:hypothetical protein
MSDSKLVPAFAAGAGVLFLMSGLHGWSVTATARDAIAGSGKDPFANLPDIDPASGGSIAGYTSGSGNNYSGSAIAADAEQYDGGPYVWGASGPPGSGNDCSGLVNHVIGADLGMSIPGYPGGRYTGHGPATGQWFTWSGCTTVSQADAEPGDLCCWLTHMGIYLGNGQMISALNPQLGVAITTIAGGSPGPEPFSMRRLKAAYATPVMASLPAPGRYPIP